MNKDNQYQDFIDDHDKYVDLIRFLKLNKITGIRKAEKHSHELHGVFLEGWPETTFREYEDTVHRYFYRKRNDMDIFWPSENLDHLSIHFNFGSKWWATN